MASKEKRGEGWSVRWVDPDGTDRRRQCPDARTADRLMREIEEAHATGRRWEPHARRNPSVTELCDEYLREQRRVWSDNTYRDRDVSLSIWQAWVEGHIRRSHVGIEVVSRSLLGSFWDHLRETRGNAKSTANLRLSHVQAWWEWCYDHDEHGSVTPRPRKLRVPTVPRVATRAPSWAQMDALIGQLRVERVRRLAILMRCTGLRHAQASALTWDDVDLDDLTLRVRPELGKTHVERTGRTVPLAPVLAVELAGWGLRSGLLVGQATAAGRNNDNRALQIGWRRAQVPAEVWRDRSSHALRKGFVTGLRLLGADKDAVEVLVGHDLGLSAVYTDQIAYRLKETVALVPAVATNVVQLRAAEEVG